MKHIKTLTIRDRYKESVKKRLRRRVFRHLASLHASIILHSRKPEL